MIYDHHIPGSPLDKHIESIFYFKGYSPEHSIERVVPTGHIHLIFELDGMTRNLYDNYSLKPVKQFTRVWISGMHKNYISISAHQQSEMFVIRFKASGAYPIFHFPICEINEQVIQAEERLGQNILDLRAAIVAAPSSKAKFELAEKWLLDRFEEEKEPGEAILSMIKKLQEKPSQENTPLNHLIKTYPNTQKHLIDQFKKYVGLTPKYYQRILRFNEILTKIQKKEKLSWTQISYDCGYADQSHFIKEFKHFSGFNPQEFILGKFNTETRNFFPLDREG